VEVGAGLEQMGKLGERWQTKPETAVMDLPLPLLDLRSISAAAAAALHTGPRLPQSAAPVVLAVVVTGLLPMLGTFCQAMASQILVVAAEPPDRIWRHLTLAAQAVLALFWFGMQAIPLELRVGRQLLEMEVPRATRSNNSLRTAHSASI
jgi:hypothetical protein